MRRLIYGWVALLGLLCGGESNAESLSLELRSRRPVAGAADRFHRQTTRETWDAESTAVIVCDMWDSHHCVNAVRRVGELAPRIDQFCSVLRDRGATIVHAPSGCMDAYIDHPARQRVASVPQAVSFPKDIESWCDRIPSEERAAYPLDQSAGGEDDDPQEHRLWAQRLSSIGRDPDAPWTRQTSAIGIDDQRDYISDSGTEIWSLLEARGIENVILVGVHTNMCVLGRPFGLRRLAQAGKNVVLARDLTDTMYDPGAWPYASHFTGTDLIVRHIERYVCPTITSDQVLGGQPLRLSGDDRVRLLIVIAEDEYDTAETLPHFAAKHLSKHFSVEFAWGSADERNEIIGLDALSDADAVLISVRRRALPEADLERLRRFISSGKPVIGIRTANHAFSLRGKKPPAGTEVWESFDADVFGGNYTNHHGNALAVRLAFADASAEKTHPIVAATDPDSLRTSGSLYKVRPLAAGTQVLLEGSVVDAEPQPVAWTFVRSDGGRSFYTSLGHPEDFQSAEFEALLAAGIHWSCGLPPHPVDEVKRQNRRYDSGGGRQR